MRGEAVLEANFFECDFGTISLGRLVAPLQFRLSSMRNMVRIASSGAVAVGSNTLPVPPSLLIQAIIILLLIVDFLVFIHTAVRLLHELVKRMAAVRSTTHRTDTH